ncbi:MAG: xanthine dehydrogenase family protein subunit M [Candidatus Aminicenantes bacterium]|nr:xanthine dehydrogenase family protein subunit M [Candidatus Aminicenantes bacterium]
MPIINEFAYVKPATVAQALKWLARYKKPAILAGGTDLLNSLKDGSIKPDAVIDIKGLDTLHKISFAGKRLYVGALVTFSELIEAEAVRRLFPVLAETARTIGSPGIRNRATMVGNICSAVPCLDSGPLLLAYDAVVTTVGRGGKREIPIVKWFRGPKKTSLKSGEIVSGVIIPLPEGKHAGCFIKLGRYAGEDLAQASVLAMALEGNRFRVAFGSVAPVPFRAKGIEKLLNGKQLDARLFAEAKKLVAAAIAPITDLRATKEYRAHMCRVMLERSLKAALGRLAGGGPAYGERLL